MKKWWYKDMKDIKAKISFAESEDMKYIKDFEDFSEYLEKMFDK